MLYHRVTNCTTSTHNVHCRLALPLVLSTQYQMATKAAPYISIDAATCSEFHLRLVDGARCPAPTTEPQNKRAPSICPALDIARLKKATSPSSAESVRPASSVIVIVTGSRRHLSKKAPIGTRLTDCDDGNAPDLSTSEAGQSLRRYFSGRDKPPQSLMAIRRQLTRVAPRRLIRDSLIKRKQIARSGYGSVTAAAVKTTFNTSGVERRRRLASLRPRRNLLAR